MKKSILSVGILLVSTLLMGGGDVDPRLSDVADIPLKSCKANKVYIEHDAKLMWQDQPYVDAEDGAFRHNRSFGKAGNWNHAMHYCRRLIYDGYSDWRLPTADELVHVHRKKGQVFHYYRANDFWSSTPATDVRYYTVFPADAYRYRRYKRESNYIRCVRCIKREDTQKGFRIRSR